MKSFSSALKCRVNNQCRILTTCLGLLFIISCSKDVTSLKRDKPLSFKTFRKEIVDKMYVCSERKLNIFIYRDNKVYNLGMDKNEIVLFEKKGLECHSKRLLPVCSDYNIHDEIIKFDEKQYEHQPEVDGENHYIEFRGDLISFILHQDDRWEIVTGSFRDDYTLEGVLGSELNKALGCYRSSRVFSFLE